MTTSKAIKTVLLCSVWGLNLSLALCMWLCGLTGNIMLGILVIVLYRPSLWFSPLAVTVICWLPLKPHIPVSKKLLFNLACLVITGVLFAVCFLISGNWY